MRMTASAVVLAAFRQVPNVRGKGRAAEMVNRILLRCGAAPIVESRMARGHLLRLDLRVPTQMHAYYSGQYDDRMLTALLTHLRPGGSAIDVGGNIGMSSVPMALAAKSMGGRLIAFEPVPSNVEWLTHNLRINNCLDCATIFPFGLSSEPGSTEIVLADDFANGSVVGNAVIAGRDFNPQFRRATIELDTLDHVWPERSRLDVIKIDIEGHEHCFLRGAKQTITKHRPAIMMERNPAHYQRQGLDFDSLIGSLLPPNYTASTAEEGDIIFMPR